MFSSIPKLNARQCLNLFIVFFSLNFYQSSAQCSLILTDYADPSSCYASDGYITLEAMNNGCSRFIRVYKSNVLIAQGTGTLTVTGLNAGDYEVIAAKDCSCPTASSRIVTLFAGNPTPLIPYVNKGSGFYQADKVYVCRGSDVYLGVQNLGVSGLSMTNPYGFTNNTPNGSSYWIVKDAQPDDSGTYIIRYTNPQGCISFTEINLTVGSLTIDAGPDFSGCPNTTVTINTTVSGQAVCQQTCPTTLDSLLVNWTLDECNANGFTNQLDYSEFVPTYVNNGTCQDVSASNVYRSGGDHSCTPIPNSYEGDIGMCVMAEESCDPNNYNPLYATKFEITLSPQQAGRLTKLTFKEQSPLIWVTTNGATGPNNYNTKYLIRVYKDNLLIFSENDLPTEFDWNLEEFDFSTHPDFTIAETTTFRFELRGYCVVQNGGNMAGWELDDIKIYGGCCTDLGTTNEVSYLWSTGESTSSIDVNAISTSNYYVTVTDCSGCSAIDSVNILVHPLPIPTISGDLEICVGETTRLTASGGALYSWSNGVNVYWQDVTPSETTTYTVTVTDDNGCVASTSVTVVVNPLPIPTISGDLEICVGETTRLTASGGAIYIWSNGVNVYWQDVTPSETTTYTVTVTDDNGCVASTSVTVVVNPLPIPTISGDLAICVGETTRLTANGGATYSWSNGVNVYWQDVTPSETTAYTVTVTDDNGCVASTSVTVIVNPLPIPTISGDLEICVGDTTRLTASGGDTYSWSNGVNVYWQDVTPSETTTYTVTVTDDNGCVASISVTVVVNPLPIPTISGDLEICVGETTRLTANGGAIYSWSNGANVYWQDVTPSETTTYTVTVTDDNGCVASTSVTVVVNPLPIPTISGDLEICVGETTRLTASGGALYSWSNGINVYWQDVTPSETTTYTVTVTDDNGCVASTSVTVVVNPLPIPTISGDLEICLGETTRLTANGGAIYSWSNGVNVYWQDVTPSETTTYTVTVTDDNGCVASTSVTVVVNPLPIPTISGNLEICVGETTRLTANGGATYSWSNGVNVYWQDVTPSETTTYTVTVTDDNGCVASTSVTVVVNLLPIPTISGDLEICVGETTRLTANGGATYSWSNGVNVYWQDVTPSETTTYTVTATDDNGCVASTSVTVVVNPLPIPTISGDLEICVGETTRLTASGGDTFSWSNGVNVYWQDVTPSETTTYTVTVTDDNGCVASTSVTVIVNPLPIPTISGDLEICVGETTRLTANGGATYSWSNGVNVYWQDVTPSETTTYTVTATDDNGCVASTSVTVVVNPLPIPTISGNLEICVGETTRLTANGGATYSWSNGVNVYWQDVTPSETTTYTVTVTDDNGCVASTSVTVVVNPLPIPTISGDLEICVGETTRLTASGGATYSWSNGVNVYWQDVTPSETTTYTVTVTDDNGCVASTSVTVVVNTLAFATITGETELCMGESTTLTVNGGSTYLWNTGSSASQIIVTPGVTTTYSVTVTTGSGCSNEATVEVIVHALPIATISGNTEICADECTTLTATGGINYEWLNLENTGYSCNSSLVVSGLQGGANQSLYNITNSGQATLIGELGTNYVNGIGFYCQAGRNPLLYGMKQFGTSITEAVRANFVTIDPVTASVTILGEIPHPTNPYGALGTTGIMTFIGDISPSGVYYFPAVAALINPVNFEIIDYTFYLGSINLNNHGNGSNVNYKIISVLPNCRQYMNNCIEAFQRYALDPSISEPSGGIQDWALAPDGETLYSFFGIENGLFRMNINTGTTSCLAGPSSNASYTGMTGVQTDEFGGIYFQNGELYGYQMDRGRFYRIDQNDGSLTLLTDDLPLNFNGDMAKCEDCGIHNNDPNNIGEVTVCPTETTTYTVIVTDENGCKSSASITVNVRDAIRPEITGNNQVCEGSLTTLTVNVGDTFIWSTGATTASIVVSPNTTTTYTVTVTDINGCTGETDFTVNVNPLPTPIVAGDLEICSGETTGLFAAGGQQYEWSNGETTAFIRVSPTSTTSYTVTVTNIAGCVASTSVTVVVNPLPIPTISGDLEICVGETTRLTANGGATYLWSNGANVYWQDVTPSETTAYTVTVTDDNGCVASTSVTVVVNPLPTPTISGDLAICVGETTRLTASGGATYSWSNGVNVYWQDVTPSETTTYTVTVTDDNGCLASTSVTVVVNINALAIISGDSELCRGESTTLTATGGSTYLWNTGSSTAQIIVTPDITTTYSVTVTTASGCQGSTSVTVVVNPLPTPTISGDLEICVGETTRLTANGGATYIWSNGANVYWQDVTPSETTTYTVMVTDDNGCVASTSVTVVVNPLPIPTISGDLEICLGETTRLTANGGATYIWSNGANVYWQDVTPSETTTYTVTVTDDNGCVASTSVTVIVNPLPIPTISGDLEICLGETTRLTANGGATYIWSNGANVYWQDVTPSETTTYTVTVTDDNGCVASTSVTVIVNPLPIPTISGDLEICLGETTRLTANGGATYIWSNGANVYWQDVTPSETTTYTVTVTDDNGCVASTSVTVVVNPLPTPTISGDLEICVGETTRLTANGGAIYSWSNGVNVYWQDVTPSETTTYTVTVTDDNGCIASTSVTVVVNPLPTPTISGDLEICVGETTRLTANGGATYSWNNGVNINWQDVTPSETTTYTVTVTDDNGCVASTSVTVVVNPLPIPTISGDLGICVGETTRLTASGGDTYLWSDGSSTSVIDVSPQETSLFTVTVTNTFGCSASTSVTVVVSPLPTIIITGMDKICSGDTTVLTASGGISYLWSTGQTTASIHVSPLTNTFYSVTVTNQFGCTDSMKYEVMIKLGPDVIVSGPDGICKGETTFLVVNGISNTQCEDVCDVTSPSVLAYWDLEACHSVMNLGTHLDYSEFTPVIDQQNCTQVTASTVHRLPGNKHSCTPGHDGNVGMCIGSQQTCVAAKVDYAQALRFQITIQPGQTGQITGLEFYEQSPENYQFIDGPGGLNNYATKFLIRISKNGNFIYYEDEMLTNRTWGKQIFNFEGNPLFKSNSSATYLFELIPYCTVNNSGLESVWDVDDIKILGGCCASSEQEVMTYLWSNGATTPAIFINPTTTTTYSVTVTDCCGCKNSSEFTVGVSDLKADLGADQTINLGQSITLSPVVTGAATCDDQNPTANELKYLWINGETTSSITVSPNVSTFYRVTVTDCNECFDTETIIIHLRMFASLVTYPNPAREMINIVSDADLDPNAKIRILQANGNTVMLDNADYTMENPRNIIVNLPSSLSNGIYIIELESGKQIVRQKLVLHKK